MRRLHKSPVGLLLLGLIALGGCQSYEPITSALCDRWCAKWKECDPATFAGSFTHARECPLACLAEWLSVQRHETAACERAWKEEFVCVADLGCDELEAYRLGQLQPTATTPCRRNSAQTLLACDYECVQDSDCRGWQECRQGACEARPCQESTDCPDGVWCVEGSCRPI
jgi:hypothetical protein